jgi:hypothetical protein
MNPSGNWKSPVKDNTDDSTFLALDPTLPSKSIETTSSLNIEIAVWPEVVNPIAAVMDRLPFLAVEPPNPSEPETDWLKV